MDGMQDEHAQFLAPPPAYEEVAPSRSPSTTSESAPPYQTYAPRPATAHDALNSAQTPDEACTYSPASPGDAIQPSTQDSSVPNRLPAYRRVDYGRYRSHPYRRPLEWSRVEDEDADLVRLCFRDLSSLAYTSDPISPPCQISELENITISDVISTPEYIDAVSHPEAHSNSSATAFSPSPNHLHPVLTTNPHDWDNLTSVQRAARLSQRIADIDYALSGLDFAMLNDLERTIIDFALFVRQNLAQRRQAELFPGHNLF
ncbi:hypothetical protein K523DRAFT_109891 [Schizophyllum commune Tattone D]|nr:hypothetical protein K523DRAFT_109891 [Schizophyllum commune Tattone D]